MHKLTITDNFIRALIPAGAPCYAYFVVFCLSRRFFAMKSEDILDWYPAQLPPVKIILGNAVLEVGKAWPPDQRQNAT